MEEENGKKRGELTESYLRLRDSIEDSVRKNNTKGNLEPDSPPRSERSHRSGGSAATNASTMLDVKNNRKRAEADLQLLANRIALLRAEEQKAVTKMLETKSRAQEILQ